MINKSILIGKRINEVRTENKETLEFVGTLVGVHKSTVQRWEQGDVEKIKLPIIEALALHYNVNPSWLAGNESPKFLEPKKHKELHDKMGLEAMDIFNSLPDLTRQAALDMLRSLAKLPNDKESK